ncbi:helix-turn-helix domain-containing protein [Chloroflexota bacterium]
MVKDKCIYGSRIRQARELNGITQIDLANRIGVKQGAISQIEKDDFQPSEEILKSIASETGFLPNFFYSEPVGEFPEGSLSFRKRSSITAREETKAYRYAQIIYEQIAKMLPKVSNVPTRKLPKLIGEKPDLSSKVTRSNLGIPPDVSIGNLVSLIENSGVFVFTLPIILPKIDAFSTWASLDIERPIIAVSSGKPMDRMRFSIAHELGHLVMHYPNNYPIKIAENQADEFASSFLLPEKAMFAELTPPITLTSVARLKTRWGVSMQAIIRRAKNLKIITERQYKYLFTQLSAHGWMKREPANLDVKIETPQLVRAIIEYVYKSPTDYALDMGMTMARATEFYVYA